MSKNDTFFKILFAVEIALLPMVFFADRFLPRWAVGLFIAGILLAKVWLELFKDRANKSHVIIDSVGSIIVFATLLIFFVVAEYVSKPLGIAVLVLVVIMNLLLPATFARKMPEFVDAVDFCYMLFECFTLLAFTIIGYYQLVTNIGLFALLLTSAVSIIYKVYYFFRRTEAISKNNKKNKK